MQIPVVPATPYVRAMPIMPVVSAFAINDPRDAAIAELQAQLRVVQAQQAQPRQVYAYD